MSLEAETLLFYAIIFTGAANILLLLKRGRFRGWVERVNAGLKGRILGTKFFEKIVYDIASDLIPKYKSVSVEKGSEGILEYIGEIVYRSTLFSFSALSVSLAAAYLFKSPLIVLFGALSFLTILYPYIDYFLVKGEKDRGVCNELVFFAFIEYVCQESGKGLEYAFNHVVRGGLFKWIRTEAKIVLTDLMVRSQDVYSSLRERASSTKAKIYRRFLDGYAGVYATGGSLLAYMAHQIEVLENDLKFRMRQFLERAQMISEVNVVLTVIMPIVVIVASNSTAGAAMQLLACTLIFVYTVAMALLIEDSRPKNGLGNTRVKPKPSEITLALIAFIACFTLFGGLWLPLAAALMTFSIAYGYRGRRRLKEVEQLEEPLAAFVRDVADYRAAGKSVYQAIALSLKEKEYNSRFKRELAFVVNRFSLNSPDIRTDTGVWLFDYVFDCLDLMQKGGGGRTSTLIELANMIEDVRMEEENVRRETGLASHLSYLAPLLFTLVSASMLALLETISAGAPSAANILPFQAVVDREWLYLMIVANTFSNTFITCLLRDGSYEGVYVAAITLAVAVACILQMDNVVHLLKSVMLGPR